MKTTSVLIIGILLGSIVTMKLFDRSRQNLMVGASNLARMGFLLGCVKAITPPKGEEPHMKGIAFQMCVTLMQQNLDTLDVTDFIDTQVKLQKALKGIQE